MILNAGNDREKLCHVMPFTIIIFVWKETDKFTDCIFDALPVDYLAILMFSKYIPDDGRLAHKFGRRWKNKSPRDFDW